MKHATRFELATYGFAIRRLGHSASRAGKTPCPWACEESLPQPCRVEDGRSHPSELQAPLRARPPCVFESGCGDGNRTHIFPFTRRTLSIPLSYTAKLWLVVAARVELATWRLSIACSGPSELRHLAFHLSSKSEGCGVWTQTKIYGFKGRCPIEFGRRRNTNDRKKIGAAGLEPASRANPALAGYKPAALPIELCPDCLAARVGVEPT